jgi:actin
MTYSSILKSDIDLRRDLFSNIVLSGGNTLFPGISERLHNEVETLAPLTTNVRVFAPQ